MSRKLGRTADLSGFPAFVPGLVSGWEPGSGCAAAAGWTALGLAACIPAAGAGPSQTQLPLGRLRAHRALGQDGFCSVPSLRQAPGPSAGSSTENRDQGVIPGGTGVGQILAWCNELPESETSPTVALEESGILHRQRLGNRSPTPASQP